MTQPQSQQPRTDYSEIQEHFSDIVGTHINPWSVSVSFGLRSNTPNEPHKMNLRVRMPLQQAKVLALMLIRGIRQYEEQGQVQVDLPARILNELGIPPEDWQRF
jgi:hypothetical protein